jgi:acid phosphatase
VLWAQTAAEHRVLAEVTYRAATAALDRALADPSWTAATEQTGDPSALPPAVVLDLDETVLDNSRFEGELVLRRTAASRDLWNQWVSLEAAGLVPGAGAFLQAARARGVAVIFVTNRTAEQQAATVANLEKHGVPASAEIILARGENGWPADKTSRRQAVAETHRVLLLLGDDLGDFLPARLAPEERVAAAEGHSAWWGERWFLLPNPSYGSWEGALYDTGGELSDRDVLLRKIARVKGFYD